MTTNEVAKTDKCFVDGKDAHQGGSEIIHALNIAYVWSVNVESLEQHLGFVVHLDGLGHRVNLMGEGSIQVFLYLGGDLFRHKWFNSAPSKP